MRQPKGAKGKSKARDLDRTNKRELVSNSFAVDENNYNKDNDRPNRGTANEISRALVPPLALEEVQQSATLEFRERDVHSDFASFLKNIPTCWHKLLWQKFDNHRMNCPRVYRSGINNPFEFLLRLEALDKLTGGESLDSLVAKKEQEMEVVFHKVKSMIPPYLAVISKNQFDQSLAHGELSDDQSRTTTVGNSRLVLSKMKYGQSNLPGPCQLLVDLDFSTTERVVLRLETSFQLFDRFQDRQIPLGVFLLQEGWCYVFTDDRGFDLDTPTTVDLIQWTGKMFPVFFLKAIMGRLRLIAKEITCLSPVDSLSVYHHQFQDTLALLFGMKERFLVFLGCHQRIGYPLPTEIIHLIHRHLFYLSTDATQL